MTHKEDTEIPFNPFPKPLPLYCLQTQKQKQCLPLQSLGRPTTLKVNREFNNYSGRASASALLCCVPPVN